MPELLGYRSASVLMESSVRLDPEGQREHASGPGWTAEGPGGFVAADPDKTPVTEDQAATIAQEREVWRRRARNRALGYALIALVIAVVAIPVWMILGGELGLFVWCFNTVRHI
jgi:hypothetical protein